MSEEIDLICGHCGHRLSDKECEDPPEGGNMFCKECGNDAWINGRFVKRSET